MIIGVMKFQTFLSHKLWERPSGLGMAKLVFWKGTTFSSVKLSSCTRAVFLSRGPIVTSH